MSLRIFTAVRHASDPREFYGGLWSGNFYPALRELGHEIVESQTDLFPMSRFMQVADGFTPQELEARATTTDRILAEVREAHAERPIDLFLSYFYNSHFDPAGFAELRQLGIPTVNFYCNSIYQFELVQAIAPAADFAWHAEQEARDRYRTVGATPIWIQMGADPSIYRPRVEVPRRLDACFMGQRYADRDRWIAALADGGIPLSIYGSGWPTKTVPTSAAPVRPEEPKEWLGRPSPRPGSLASYGRLARELLSTEGVWGTARRLSRMQRHRRETRAIAARLDPSLFRGRAGDIAETFAAHAICLNFSNVWADGRVGSDLIPHVRLRDFEGPMCRTCYLTGHTAEIEEFYEVGSEVDCYGSPEELVDKCRFYLAHPEAAERLREAGYRRALRDHTWVRRFEQLIAKIGLKTTTPPKVSQPV